MALLQRDRCCCNLLLPPAAAGRALTAAAATEHSSSHPDEPALQVEALTQELTDLQRRAVDRGVLDAAEEARVQAEARAQAVEREREGIAAEVEEMQKALARLQQEAGAENQARVRQGARGRACGMSCGGSMNRRPLGHAEPLMPS